MKDFKQSPSKAIKVKELIAYLKKCDPDSKVYYTLGGSCNFEPVSYIEENIFHEERAKHPLIIIGRLTW